MKSFVLAGRSKHEIDRGSRTFNTIVFGEKFKDSPHNHMDFYQGDGNDFEEVNQSKHRAGNQAKESGGSNYAFVDGASAS